MSNTKYPIKYVSKVTGFSSFLLRTWENRYNLIKPERTNTNRRLYSEKDLDKLIQIKQAINKGMKIGQISKMNYDELIEFNANDDEIQKNSDFDEEIEKPDDFVKNCIDYIKDFNNLKFESYIEAYSIKLNKKDFIVKYILKLLNEIGRLWENGDLRISNEHFATSIIRAKLTSMIELKEGHYVQSIVVATPKNQNHELVALSLSVIISMYGFRVIYLGANVPSEEIIYSVWNTKSIALVLSIIFPYDDFSLIEDLQKIEKHLLNVPIYTGGNAAINYLKKLSNSKMQYINEIDEFVKKIKKLHKTDT